MSVKARTNRLNALVELGIMSEDERNALVAVLTVSIPAE